MSDQPEALSLSDQLRDLYESADGNVYRWANDAAAELRRQHSEIEALKAERDGLRVELNIAVGLLKDVAIDAARSKT